MTDFYVKVPDDKVDFFNQLIRELGYESEQFTKSDGLVDLDEEEEYFTDDDV